MKFNILVTLFLSFFLVGCATKREYFSPTDEQVLGKHNYDKSLNNENIAYITAEGATLKDGSVITKSGYLSKIKLDKKEKFLTIADNKVISSNIDGTLKIRDLDGNLLFEHKFLVQALSANLRGDDLALVTANNALHLIKVSTKTVVLTERGEPTLAYDSRLAKPLFAGSGIVLYPMLDGRVAIAHLPSGSMVQDLYISNEPFFNSVIFLEIAGDNMYAATATALLMNSSVGNKRVLENVKDLFRYQDKIYVFRKDGVVKIFDLQLNELKEKKFKFAIFSAVMPKENNIYIFEKTGYLIKTDLNLENEQIFELESKINELSFVNEFAFYYDDEYMELK